LKKVRSCKLLVLVAGIAFAMPAAAQDSVEPADTDYDRMPANTIIPEYPEMARLERIEGEVQVCFDISREGFPQRVKVRRSTHRYFEKPARDAVRGSTWRPVPHGQKVPGIKGCRTFRFTLEPVPLEERD
jgi:TonB family protein